MKKTWQTISVLLTIGSFSVASGQELLPNPGFDDLDNSGSFGDGWGSFGAAGFHDFFGGNPHASLFSDNPGNFGGVFHTGIAGTAGQLYQFDLVDVRLEENVDANYRFGLEFYLGDDSTQISADLVSMDLSTTGDGLSFSTTATAPAGTVFVRPLVLFDDVQSTAAGQENVFIFTASLTAIPEPASLLLLAGGALAAAWRRR